MPKLTIVTSDGDTVVDVPSDARLVLAIEEAGVGIGHRCGGNARCTTCQVEVLEGEPEVMTAAEYAVLTARDLYGKVRLACQLVCDRDLRVRPVMTTANQDWPNPGPAPEPTVTPEAHWVPRTELEAGEA
jgi:ferredoxin